MSLTFTQQQLSQFSNAPVAECPKNWIELEYLYCDGSGVSGAQYVLADASTGFRSEGSLGGSGRARVELPTGISNINFYFHNDPDILEIKIEPKPHGLDVITGWLDRVATSIRNIGSWLWGVLQGDFNEDPSLGQIITNTIISMIPVVDQIADIRDLTANLKALIWDKKYNEYAPWVALVLTLLGLIPTLGSLLKGICKAVWQGVRRFSLDDLLKVFNHFAKGNGAKWLKRLHSEGLDTAGRQCTAKLVQILISLKSNLSYIRSKIPQSSTLGLSEFRSKILATIEAIDIVIRQAPAMIQRVIDDLKRKLKEILEHKSTTTHDGAPRQTNTHQQEARNPHLVSADFLKTADHMLSPGHIANRGTGITAGHSADDFRRALQGQGEILKETPVQGLEGVSRIEYNLYRGDPKGGTTSVLQSGGPRVKTVFDSSWDKQKIGSLAQDLFGGKLQTDGTIEATKDGVEFIGWVRDGVLQSFGVK